MTSDLSGLVDLLGGYDGGRGFWLAALAAVELAVRDARAGADGRFVSWPANELGRFLRQLDDALGLAVTGTLIQSALSGDELREPPDVAEMLLSRARQAGAEYSRREGQRARDEAIEANRRARGG